MQEQGNKDESVYYVGEVFNGMFHQIYILPRRDAERLQELRKMIDHEDGLESKKAALRSSDNREPIVSLTGRSTDEVYREYHHILRQGTPYGCIPTNGGVRVGDIREMGSLTILRDPRKQRVR